MTTVAKVKGGAALRGVSLTTAVKVEGKGALRRVGLTSEGLV